MSVVSIWHEVSVEEVRWGGQVKASIAVLLGRGSGEEEEGEQVMGWRSRGGGGGERVISRRWAFLLCLGSFCVGLLFTNRMWTMPEPKDVKDKLKLASGGCDSQTIHEKQLQKEALEETSSIRDSLEPLDRTISELEMELAAARAAQESLLNGSPISEEFRFADTSVRRKYFMVIGINTAFNSRKRRDSVRNSWMPQGEKRKKLEEEKGIVIRFVIGHSAISGGIVDRSIEAEDRKHGDFMRLDHVEGYLELSGKTKAYFATAVSLWDAEFYIKVDDDVHVNIATLGHTLGKYLLKPRVYIGCMKSGPVLAQKGVRYHEPEHWKFGGSGNKYFRHATGQLYVISKDLATYISTNHHMLHKYANEDVSLGSWFIGLDAEYIDDRKLCCGTPPDCEWKAQAGNICAASFDWTCSGICNSVDRMREVHQRCGEGEKILQDAVF